MESSQYKTDFLKYYVDKEPLLREKLLKKFLGHCTSSSFSLLLALVLKFPAVPEAGSWTAFIQLINKNSFLIVHRNFFKRSI